MFCHITTMIQGDKYATLLEEKKGEGWPHFVFMDAEGSILAIHEDEPSAAGFGRTGEKVKAFSALKEKAAKGDKAAQVDLLLAQLEMFKEAKPTKEQEAKFASLLVNTSVMQEVEALENKDQEKALAKKYYERCKEGKPGPTSDQAMQPYYVLALTYAEEQKDVATFEAVFATLKGKFGHVEAAKGFFEEKAKKLEELKKK